MPPSGQNLLECLELAPASIATGFEDTSTEVACVEQTGEDMVAHWSWVHAPHVTLGECLQNSGSSWAIALGQVLAILHVADLGANIGQHLVGLLEHLVHLGLSMLSGPLLAKDQLEGLEPDALEALEACHVLDRSYWNHWGQQKVLEPLGKYGSGTTGWVDV